MTITFDATGRENALSATLAFAPAQWRFVSAESNVENAQLLLNESALAQGKLGVMIALPSGKAFAKGQHALVTTRFIRRHLNAAPITFDDSFFLREAVDIHARPIALGDQIRVGVR